MFVPEPAFDGCSDADCGSAIITSASVVMPCLTSSSALIVVTGRASSAARRLMLEPVTSTRWIGASDCCACACWVRLSTASAIEDRTKWREV